MAWIESHQELGRHPKTLAASRLLGVSRVAVVGHLHFLWWWALDFAQDGDVTRYSAAVLAEASAWEGEAERFIAALTDCGAGDEPGFLDRTDDGRLLIHDWYDYAGKLADRRATNAARMRAARANAPIARSSARAPYVQDTSPARAPTTVPNLTVPYQTQPPSPTDSGLRARAREAPTAPPPEATPDQPSTHILDDAEAVEQAATATPAPEQQAAMAVPVVAETSAPPARRRQSKGAAVLDGIRALGVEPSSNGRDWPAIRDCSDPAEEIAAAYVAVTRGEWGDDWLIAHLSIAAVCARMGGYHAWRSGVRARASPNGRAAEYERKKALLERVIAGGGDP